MRILLGADGSVFSRIAEELILRLPEWRRAEVVAASVAPAMTMRYGAEGHDFAQRAVEAFETGVAEAKDHAEEAAGRLRQRGVNASEAYLEGDAADLLLGFVERNAIDAIAVGSRGRGALESAILGSTARKLAADAPCHVLIGRVQHKRSPQETLQKLKGSNKLSVLAGVDGSEGARVAIDFVANQGPFAFDKLVAVCAEPLGAVPSGIDPSGFIDLYSYDHERAVEVVHHAVEKLKGSAPMIACDTGLGRPASILGKKAQEHGTDLLIVGATRHGTLERFLIGSVSCELASEASCSVLVVRPAAA